MRSGLGRDALHLAEYLFLQGAAMPTRPGYTGGSLQKSAVEAEFKIESRRYLNQLARRAVHGPFTLVMADGAFKPQQGAMRLADGVRKSHPNLLEYGRFLPFMTGNCRPKATFEILSLIAAALGCPSS